MQSDEDSMAGNIEDLSNNYVALGLLSAFAFQTPYFLNSLETRAADWLASWDKRMAGVEPLWRGSLEKGEPEEERKQRRKKYQSLQSRSNFITSTRCQSRCDPVYAGG